MYLSQQADPSCKERHDATAVGTDVSQPRPTKRLLKLQGLFQYLPTASTVPSSHHGYGAATFTHHFLREKPDRRRIKRERILAVVI
ncbi:hypothetical protein TWF481_002588 [Arthrobotrys musiformis]|uniref:Uncharacterized protein n=1 Tax=Arthrobotrys musiformis TaxID=47236 RepID=A0AAV9VST2_9PEZI